ncbi:MAG: DUF3313 domain-containing protein [Myxococcota bacterium]|nr:DUF3313 domain-containing protein [Myxococcota bacterium]
MVSTARLCIVVLFLVTIAGCAQSGRGRKVEDHGFLGEDFAKLEEGEDDDYQLTYVNPNADFAKYDKLILDPVTVWLGKETSEVDPADRQRLADNFYKLLYEAASQYFTVVQEPGPNTLRVRVALTDIKQSNVTLDTVSSVVPQMRVLTSVSGYASGKPAFTGEAAYAFKVFDAQTGELLRAGAEKRVGSKSISGSTDKWSDVDNALKYWAELSSYRMCVEIGRPDCQAPEIPKGF